MSSVLVAPVERDRTAGAAARGAGRLFEVPGGGPTLERAVAVAWEDLVAAAAATCPVCHDRLIAEHSAGGRLLGGRCRSCGARLD